MHAEAGILVSDEFFNFLINCRDLFSSLHRLNKEILGLRCDRVSSLLLFLRIHDKRARCHRRNVAVFATDVDVNSLELQFFVVRVNLKLVNIELTARLDHNWKGVVEETRTAAGVLRSKVAHNVVIVEVALDSLLNYGMFYLFVLLDNVLHFFYDLVEGPLGKCSCNF